MFWKPDDYICSLSGTTTTRSSRRTPSSCWQTLESHPQFLLKNATTLQRVIALSILCMFPTRSRERDHNVSWLQATFKTGQFSKKRKRMEPQSAEDEPARQEVNKCRERRRVARSGVKIWKHIPSSLDQFQASSAAEGLRECSVEWRTSSGVVCGTLISAFGFGLPVLEARQTPHTETEKHPFDLYHYDTGRLAWGGLLIRSTAGEKVNRRDASWVLAGMVM